MIAILLVALQAATGTSGWDELPFRARVDVESLHVRRAPSADAPVVGMLRQGDEVTVTECVPDCHDPQAWGLLAADGAVRLAHVIAVADTQPPPAALRYRYGRVRVPTTTHASADGPSRVIAHHRAGEDLAFVDDAPLAALGWLRRAGGGVVRAAAVQFHTPSSFAGAHGVSLPLALEHCGVRRVARRHARPSQLTSDARWVHVDLSQQTLVAYEGDQPVFATLVSTGRGEYETPTGLASVYHKEIHAPMHGEQPDPYFVDEVPYVQFLRHGVALHGTFWHERFGRRTSHGCINLSVADAEWLFAWAPPRLPAGWHAVTPSDPAVPSLWVLVTR